MKYTYKMALQALGLNTQILPTQLENILEVKGVHPTKLLTFKMALFQLDDDAVRDALAEAESAEKMDLKHLMKILRILYHAVEGGLNMA